VADGFDVVAVGIEDEGAMVVLVVLGPYPRSAVVAAAGGASGSVECVDQRAVVGAECDLGGRRRRCLRDPEVG
jgi:hypothetical protein